MTESERRRKRNDLVKAWGDALGEVARGTGTVRQAEQAAVEVLHWRRIVGELEDVEYHRQLAALLDREVERVEALYAMRTTSEEHLGRMRLYALREHVLAGKRG